MPTEAVQETPLLVENTTDRADGLQPLDWHRPPPQQSRRRWSQSWALAGAQVAPPSKEKAI